MKMMTIYKWLLLLALTAYVVFAAVWAYGQAEKATCQGIEVAFIGSPSVDSITSKGVVAELARYDKRLIGSPLSQIDTRRIERYLNRLNNFEQVECVITSKDKLRICVLPMVPELRVFEGEKSYYINKDGKHIPAKAEFYADVPIVEGRFSKTFTAKDILPVARFIENDPFMHDLVTMIVARDKDNIILVPRFTGHVINIGDTTDLATKRRNLIAAYKRIIPYRGWETYDTISVKFRGQIVATRRNKALPSHHTLFPEESDPEEATLEGLTEDVAHTTHNKPDSASVKKKSTGTKSSSHKPDDHAENTTRQ